MPVCHKIFRLPIAIRSELNQRIFAGADRASLLAWLNSLPGVKAVFENAPLIEKDLLEWEQDGYRRWAKMQNQMRAVSAAATQAARAAADGGGRPLEFVKLATDGYAAALRAWDGKPNGESYEMLKVLRGILKTALAIQRTNLVESKLDRDLMKVIGERLAARGWAWRVLEQTTGARAHFCIEARHPSDGRRFVVAADNLMTAFTQIDRQIEEVGA
jgi:hypothetical protein